MEDFSKRANEYLKENLNLIPDLEYKLLQENNINMKRNMIQLSGYIANIKSNNANTNFPEYFMSVSENDGLIKWQYSLSLKAYSHTGNTYYGNSKLQKGEPQMGFMSLEQSSRK